MQVERIVVPRPVGEVRKFNFFFWNRLEPRARSDDFSRSIQAQVRDPLWFLARQWQMGEFKGDDAGSPVKLDLKLERTLLSRYSPGLPGSGAPVKPIDGRMPLEIVVERESMALDWRKRVQIGQQVERILLMMKGEAENDADRQRVQNVIDHFKTNYPLEPPTDEERLDLDDVTWRFLTVMADKGVDGGKLRQAGLISENPAVSGLQDPELNIAVTALKNLYAWYKQLYHHTEQTTASPWRHDQIEYEFSVSAPKAEDSGKQNVLVASEYKGGALDWYAFSAVRDPNQRLGPDALPGEDLQNNPEYDDLKLVPTNISFRGMPNARWWEFEDRQTDFGDLDTGTTDLGKLLVMEFALIYGNDWFIIPAPLNIGSLCRIITFTVTDVFGMSKAIQRAGSQPGEEWQKAWNMYSVSFERSKDFAATTNGDEQPLAEDFLLLPPTLGRSEESPALEDVRFLRDEMANMVWAVEHTLLSGLGDPLSGYEYHRDRRRREEEQRNREDITRIQEATRELGELAAEAATAAARAAEATTPESLAAAAEEAREKLDEVQRRAAEAGSDILGPAEVQGATAEDMLISYRLASTVPGNWISYIPVQTDQARRAVQLRRAAMVSEGAQQGWEVVHPKTQILNSAPEDHRVKEEAVSRAGTKIQLAAQRTRWIDGSTHLWLGRRSGPGRGEGSSGLRFDYLVDK